jgi:hypothetical protein
MDKVKELLRGFRVDLESVQVVGNMAVVPLVSDEEFKSRVSDVDEVVLDKDVDYGTLRFKNQSGGIGIVLQGATIVTQQKAQDRTVPRAVILKGKAVENVSAFCVQSSQCGLIRTDQIADEFKDESPFFILPPTLRASALERANGNRGNFSGLWDSLSKYSGTFAGVGSSSHLKDIYDRYRVDLDKFVAQFEPVPNQLGAIVIIDRQVVAVDIMPTYRSWKIMWRGLIRDSYGVEALRTASAGKGELWHYDLNAKNVTDLGSLRAEMQRTMSNLVAAIRQSWSEVDNDTLVTQVANEITGVRLVNVESERFQGQAVIHDEHTVYLSLVPKGSTTERKTTFKRQSQTYNEGEFHF